MMGSATSLSLVIIDKEEDFLELEGCWDILLEQSAIRTPFLTWDWIRLWWSFHRETVALRVAVVRDGEGRIVGIAPLVLGRGIDGPRRFLQHLFFMGGLGDVASEGLDFIIPRGYEPYVAPLLAQTFAKTRNEWDILELSSLHHESPNVAILRQVMRESGTFEHRFAPVICFFYDLPKSWDEVLVTMSARTRNYHQRTQDMIVNKHSGQFLVADRDLPVEDAFDAVQRLHGMRFRSNKSTFIRPVSVDFHRELAKRWAPSGRAILPCIQLDGQIAAARYGFTHFGHYWDFQTGFNPAYSKISLGKMGMAWAMQCAIERGLSVFDHLPGDQDHKRHRSTSSRMVYHIESFNPRSTRALLFESMRRVLRQMRK
jgi:CelD/BcsL family acetyltransferase involved in cellulose biosynthesis